MHAFAGEDPGREVGPVSDRPGRHAIVPQTIRYARRHLPHWEVEAGRYFLTVRRADSLPLAAIGRLRELSANLTGITASSRQFAAYQREIFRTLEKYLDAGTGTCPLRVSSAAMILLDEFAALSDWQCEIPHYSIMPNHWHALLVPASSCSHSLSEIMKRLKGRTAKRLRAVFGGTGAVWQREWFDRWIRDEAEWQRLVGYIRNNPVKSGIVPRWSEHPWTR